MRPKKETCLQEEHKERELYFSNFHFYILRKNQVKNSESYFIFSNKDKTKSVNINC
jgi:hypothetical protein